MEASQVYKLMTKHRLAIFGIATLWIFFRHTFYYDQVQYSFLTPIVQIGDCGVDIFLFLSGFGLYFSYAKCFSKKEFYKKRVIRILPTVLFLIGLFAISSDLIHGQMPITVFSPKYWFYSVYANYWFIGAILFLYVLFPFICFCVKQNAILTLVLTFIISLIVVTYIHLFNIGIFSQLVVYFARLPIFVLGVIFAHHQYLLVHKKTILILLFLSIPCLFYFPKDFQRMMYFPLAVAICTILPRFLDKMPTRFSNILSRFGKISLEFYLIHVFLLGIGIVSFLNKEFDVNIYVGVLVTFLFTTICSMFSSFIISKITQLLGR